MFALEKSAAVAIWAKLRHRDAQENVVSAIGTPGASLFSPQIAQSSPETINFLMYLGLIFKFFSVVTMSATDMSEFFLFFLEHIARICSIDLVYHAFIHSTFIS